MRISTLILMVLLFCSACTEKPPVVLEPTPDALSFLGTPLFSPEPSTELMARYEARKLAYEADSLNIESLIWYGRFAAYIGDYAKAIEIYSRGIELAPEDARLYRHRGHRYISVRKLDLAILDLETAARLTESQPNQIEPDGMPNAQNMPVSTLQGNIWYHLGLAHYLNHDLDNALRGFSSGLATSTNDDNVVSTTHWIYMIHRRMGNEEAATESLERASQEMNIIENFAYHQLVLFYKGQLDEASLTGDGSANDAILYGIANWHLYNDHPDLAREKFESIVANSAWASFGTIAAESDLAMLFKPN